MDFRSCGNDSIYLPLLNPRGLLKQTSGVAPSPKVAATQVMTIHIFNTNLLTNNNILCNISYST